MSNNIRNRLKYANIFEYDFLKVGEVYEFLYEPTQEVLSGTLQEMFVNRQDEDDVWVSFLITGEAQIYDFKLSSLAFDSGEEDEVVEDLLGFAVKFVSEDENAILPTYGSEGASGMDFYAIKNYQIPPGASGMVDTGLRIELPDGFEMQLRSRSSIGKRGLILGNGVGTIDNDYRGRVMFAFWNVSPHTVDIERGERIGQGVLAPVFRGIPVLVEELSDTTRGEGGFGSTGR